MMFAMQTTSNDGGLWRTTVGAVRSFATSRRGLLLVAFATIGGGVAANWGWMIAIGAAPIILAALPCAAMCAVGACMPMMMGRPKTKAPLVIDVTVNQNNSRPAAPQLSAPPDRAL